MKPYVLVTAARDEEKYIEKTILSVISQTHLPKVWVIVNDGSVDRTGEIISAYAETNPFIRRMDRPKQEGRNYGAKTKAFTYGYETLREEEFDFVGNLDADVSFEPNYYEGMISRFLENDRLGVAGGLRIDVHENKLRAMSPAENSAGGPTQFFRRQCFEDIGGYQVLRYGGIDTVAETTARMKGWEVRTFPEFVLHHYRPTGTAGTNVLGARFKRGILNYSVGYHPLFEIAISIFRVFNPPPIIGSLAFLAGYFWAYLNKYERTVSEDFIRFLRAEQLERLSGPFSKK